MKLTHEELQRRGRLEALNEVMRGVSRELEISQTTYLETETRDVAHQAAETLRVAARSLMDPNDHPTVQPAVLVDIMDRTQFQNQVAFERARHAQLGYTAESDREKGVERLLLIAGDYARRGKIIEAHAIHLAIIDLLQVLEADSRTSSKEQIHD